MKDTSVNKLKFGTDKITNGASSDLKLQKTIAKQKHMKKKYSYGIHMKSTTSRVWESPNVLFHGNGSNETVGSY